MKYRTLGKTGIKVSPYCLGAMMLGAVGGNPDHEDSIRIIHKALDAGINFIDTALYAALEVAKRPESKGKTIVVILPDTGERYLSIPDLFDA